ncbi:PP2C family protein-serine/threonine phosphatase [Roseovarius aestuariivivens]|uniref:PP2C family protein-serine/threonine phosphatase n=1 Tax=Roseovarius aestuariivivens TaxID=1888910 RepID=UPI001FDA0CA2|nr:SpoIIE family protein phosphatase [Roseovarius aestuariivivens]
MGAQNVITAAPVSEDRAIQTVLVVDDSRLQRRILAASLTNWGYRVCEAGSGAEALDICRAMAPDLVLSDWMMPGMNGLDFCRAFRSLGRDDYGYFILLTSKSDKADIALGLDAGADDFLTKPVNPAELRARISAGERIVRMQRELSDKNRLIESTLSDLQVLYDSLDSDLLEARKLQQSLVSERFQDFGPAELSLLLRSAGHVGGDLVGSFPVSETRLGIYAIDVSGHGISSALMTARLAGYLSATAPEQNVALMRGRNGGYFPRPPAETIALLNTMFLGEIETEHYFTLLLADVALDTGLVTMAQAGHPSPAILRRDGRVEMVGTGGLPVGLIDGAEFEQFEITLSPGDRLLVHSDGITECETKTGGLLGEAGLTDILRRLRQCHGLAFLESLVWHLAECAGSDVFDDDISAVLLDFKAPAPAGF